MKIKEIVKSIQKCIDADIESKDYRSIRSIMYGNTVYIRDTKTSKIFNVNYWGNYAEYDECGHTRNAIIDLDGDYEYYDPVRVYGVGYLLSNEQTGSGNNENSSEESMTLSSILECARQRKEVKFCGIGCTFYIGGPSAEVRIMSISDFAHHNYRRKKVGTRCSIPFDMNMPDNAYAVLLIECQDEYSPECVSDTWSRLDELFANYGSITKLDLKTSYGLDAN